MKLRVCALSVLGLFAASSVLAAPGHYSDVTCAASSRIGHCDLEWDFSATPRLRYTIEKLNPDTGRWNIVHAHNAMHLRARRTVEPGNLYRVRGCDLATRKGLADCVSSHVIWAPIYLAAESIPAEVVDSSGQVMAVDKSAGHDVQLEQYNVYMLVRLIGRRAVDLAELPPMKAVSEEDIWRDGAWSPTAAMQRSVYLNYSGMQEIVRARAAPDPSSAR